MEIIEITTNFFLQIITNGYAGRIRYEDCWISNINWYYFIN
jgi:hypothetical protein